MGIEDATRQLQAARDAGGSTYAPLEVRNAEERLSMARAAAGKKDYEGIDDITKIWWDPEATGEDDLGAGR